MKRIIVVMAAISIGGPGVTNCLTGLAAEAGTTFNVQLYWAPDGPQPEETALMPIGAKLVSSSPECFSQVPGRLR